MKIKFFITFISLSLMAFIGMPEEDQLRLQQITINLSDSDNYVNESEVSELLVAALNKLSVENIEVIDSQNEATITINFLSNIDPSEIKESIVKFENENFQDETFDLVETTAFKVTYFSKESDGSLGCEGILLKDNVREFLRSSILDYDLAVTSYLPSEFALTYTRKKQISNFITGHTSNDLYELPESRAGPIS